MGLDPATVTYRHLTVTLRSLYRQFETFTVNSPTIHRHFTITLRSLHLWYQISREWIVVRSSGCGLRPPPQNHGWGRPSGASANGLVPKHVIYDPPGCPHNRPPFNPLYWCLWCPLGCPLGCPLDAPRGSPGGRLGTWGVPPGGPPGGPLGDPWGVPGGAPRRGFSPECSFAKTQVVLSIQASSGAHEIFVSGVGSFVASVVAWSLRAPAFISESLIALLAISVTRRRRRSPLLIPLLIATSVFAPPRPCRPISELAASRPSDPSMELCD